MADISLQEAAQVILDHFELKTGPHKKDFFETRMAQENLKRLKTAQTKTTAKGIFNDV